ncbi:MAG: mechanosensitive ion channel [Cyanothece sp. SIO1E1]|nr:mechanosensitive ion channel [Cyanothece sp. SIO1E1]
MDSLNTLEKLFTDLVGFLPNLLAALMILFIGWIIARIIAKVLQRVLKAIKIDRLAEKLNDIEMVANSDIDIKPSIFLSKLIYYVLMFIFFIAATDALGMEAVSELMSNILNNFLPNALAALIVFVIGIIAADFLKKLVKTACDSLAIPAASLIANVVFYFIFLNILIVTLAQLGIDTGFMETNLSVILAGIVLAFSIGYGMASRPVMSNYLASFYSKGRVKIGVTLRINGMEGKVIAIDNASIVIRTQDSKVIVPLSRLNTETFEIVED